MANVYNDYQLGFIKSLLAQPEFVTDLVDVVSPEDIEDVNLQRVYNAILDLYLAKKDITIAGIALEIEKSGAGIDPVWLFGLEKNVIDFVKQADPVTWGSLVKRESTRAKAKRATVESLAEIDNLEQSPLEVINETSKKLEDIARNALSKNNLTIADSVTNFFDENQKMLEEGITQHRIPSAYPSLDYYTRGWGPGQLITIGARTAVGKTTFAMNCVTAAMSADESVLFFSLEMNERELFARLFASLTMIDIATLEDGLPLNDEEREELMKAKEMVQNSKLAIDTESNVTIEYIKSRAIQQAQSENGLDMIVVDYLQLISGAPRASRQETVADISRNLKQLAGELNIPIMVLVQLNREERGVGADDEQIPKLRDIRESGAIANDSNVVILLHRKVTEDELVDPKALFIVEKNRQGPAGKFINVRCMLECNLFIDEGSRKAPELSDEQTYADTSTSLNNSEEIPERYGDEMSYIEESLENYGEYISDENTDYLEMDNEELFD